MTFDPNLEFYESWVLPRGSRVWGCPLPNSLVNMKTTNGDVLSDHCVGVKGPEYGDTQILAQDDIQLCI